jgi:uncharacterized protein (TIGR00255 family)
MTGFGYAEYQDQAHHMILELKSYNNRYLDLIISLPPPLSPLEPKLRDVMNSRFSRGRIEMSLRLRELEEDIDVYIDKKIAEEYAAKLRELQETLDIREDMKLGHILGMEGVLKIDKNRDLDVFWKKIGPLFDEAADQLEEDKVREGCATEENITEQLELISETVSGISSLAGMIEEKTKQTLSDKFREVMGQEIDENRILSETAAYLVRYDINEEIHRLETHLKSFRETMKGDGTVGKKLDFICQEFNREINTIGSKSSSAEISRNVIDAKNAIEKIREQLRNVE